MFGDDEVPCICASHASAVEFWYGVGVLDVTKIKTAPLVVVVVGGFTPSIQIFSQPTVIVVERCPPADTGDGVPVHGAPNVGGLSCLLGVSFLCSCLNNTLWGGASPRVIGVRDWFGVL